jgi:hypothetical protein
MRRVDAAKLGWNLYRRGTIQELAHLRDATIVWDVLEKRCTR